ncbi:hypothetical protein R1sor_018472 [Riccia sorocarpa]|uniref:Uncharacterized protein n=1 Tax=Riccia sorocarpa TaxID=122646 RepID=A0ABD3IDD6_9MARC
MILQVSVVSPSVGSSLPILKLIHLNRNALVSAPSATQKIRNSLFSSSPVQLEGEYAAGAGHPYRSLEALNSSRNWSNVYSGVADNEPSTATDGRMELEEFEFNPFRDTRKGFNQELLRVQTDELKQEILSGDFKPKPTPFTPVEGTEALQFYIVCALLFVAFWVGNYLAPDFIFRNTVFRSRTEEEDVQNDGVVQNHQQVDGNQEQSLGCVPSVDSSIVSIKAVDGQSAKVGIGFDPRRYTGENMKDQG